ncbi:MAG: phosphohistidine phosphatase SixA [Desulfobacteraceae bacterium]|nr:phosphohistidine phosphatase SixA [Desulfobacteraceae bacterium]
MALFLVQHGLSLPKDKDPDKGLSKKGLEDTKKIAEVAKAYKIPVSMILHSGKNRAEKTALIFNETLDLKEPCKKMQGIKPLDDVKAIGDKIDPNANIMLVGHLPFMEKLVSYLITENEDLKIYKFQNSGIVCLDNEDNRWFIKWTLNPDIS